jgi:hypothetical protein
MSLVYVTAGSTHSRDLSFPTWVRARSKALAASIGLVVADVSFSEATPPASVIRQIVSSPAFVSDIHRSTVGPAAPPPATALGLAHQEMARMLFKGYQQQTLTFALDLVAHMTTTGLLTYVLALEGMEEEANHVGALIIQAAADPYWFMPERRTAAFHSTYPTLAYLGAMWATITSAARDNEYSMTGYAVQSMYERVPRKRIATTIMEWLISLPSEGQTSSPFEDGAIVAASEEVITRRRSLLTDLSTRLVQAKAGALAAVPVMGVGFNPLGAAIPAPVAHVGGFAQGGAPLLFMFFIVMVDIVLCLVKFYML